jgi:hypothetical protein
MDFVILLVIVFGAVTALSAAGWAFVFLAEGRRRDDC